MSKGTAKLRRKPLASAGVQTKGDEPLTYQRWQESFADPRKRRAIIQQIGELIGREFHPEKIILFGSQAYGTPKWYSDIDLLVVLPHVEDALEQSVAMLKQLNLPISIDLLTRTPQQLFQRLAMGDKFIKEILERGQIIYETHHARMD
jgi:predicted nucleotidyltransferase